MKYSIILPAYNCSQSLLHVIDSIYSSGLTDFEIILVNDGSTDDTGKIALQIAGHCSELHVISQENSGVSAARNRGIQEATGEYMLFVDADDSLEPGSLANVSAILEIQDPDMLLFGMAFDYYHRGHLYRSDVLSYPKRGSMCGEEWRAELEQLFRTNMLSPVWNKLIRRELILNNHIAFREDMIEMEDYLFSTECLVHSDRIYLLDRAVYHYRQAEDERGTFSRLWRIRSLSDYMTPFYEIAQSPDAMDGLSEPVSKIADQIYSMLFHEQLRFASRRQIQLAAEDMLSGRYSEQIKQSDAALYEKLREKQYTRVWCEGALRRMRHWAAVQVKYIHSLRKSI